MISFIPWIEVTIPGFIYLTAGFFILLRVLGNRDFSFVEKLHAILPYIAVGVLFISYFFGLSAHLVTEEFISWKYPQYESNVKAQCDIIEKAPAQTREALGSSYGNLVMFRHLFSSTFALGFALLSWLWKSKYEKNKWHLFVLCLILSFLFLWTSRIQADQFAKLRNNIESRYAR